VSTEPGKERMRSDAGARDGTGSVDRPLLAGIRAVHSAIFLVELGSILWLLLTGIANRRDRSVALAAGLVSVESAVFILNDQTCPLTPLAERHGAAKGSVSDIFLPDPIARTIPIWSSALLAIAFALHLRGVLRARRQRRVVAAVRQPPRAVALVRPDRSPRGAAGEGRDR
jgi:hypothetical protein